ncbi:hypothetical protein [Candidatus Poriferisocius sp.]|uniref:hypothetical protein n=1 Tax=Candidatus Poriferisocius sp. TaxID=3101276 RepID=UPI003B021BF2
MPRPDLSDAEGVGAAIEAEAEKQRRGDRSLAQFELEIEQTWADVAPTEAPVDGDGPPLDQTARLAVLDPQVPIGSRRGLRGIKWVIRKLAYWYVRFLTDQFNVFAEMLMRHLRSLEARLGKLEAAAGHPVALSGQSASDWLDDPPELSPAVVACVAGLAGPGPCLVLSGGEGAMVEADDEGFGTIILAGFVEKLPVSDLLGVIHEAGRKLGDNGRIIVAVADPTNRGRVDSELGSGLGISPTSWRHLLERAGFNARLVPCSDTRITEIVVADRSTSPSRDSVQSQP